MFTKLAATARRIRNFYSDANVEARARYDALQTEDEQLAETLSGEAKAYGLSA